MREEFEEKTKNLKSQTFRLAREKIGKVKGACWLYDRIVDFARDIQENIPDHLEYVAYHIMIGSSIFPPELFPKFDLPEPYSVAKFFEKTIKKLEEKNFNI